MPVFDRHWARLASRWVYNPYTNPLVIRLTIGSAELAGYTFPLARQLVMEAFAHAPALWGAGLVRVQVRDQRTMQLVLMPEDDPAKAAAFFASTQAVMNFAQSTLNMVPVCGHGVCRSPGCFECAWLVRVTPACACGVVGCTSFRSVEFPEQEAL